MKNYNGYWYEPEPQLSSGQVSQEPAWATATNRTTGASETYKTSPPPLPPNWITKPLVIRRTNETKEFKRIYSNPNYNRPIKRKCSDEQHKESMQAFELTTKITKLLEAPRISDNDKNNFTDSPPSREN